MSKMSQTQDVAQAITRGVENMSIDEADVKQDKKDKQEVDGKVVLDFVADLIDAKEEVQPCGCRGSWCKETCPKGLILRRMRRYVHVRGVKRIGEDMLLRLHNTQSTTVADPELFDCLVCTLNEAAIRHHRSTVQESDVEFLYSVGFLERDNTKGTLLLVHPETSIQWLARYKSAKKPVNPGF